MNITFLIVLIMGTGLANGMDTIKLRGEIGCVMENKSTISEKQYKEHIEKLTREIDRLNQEEEKNKVKKKYIERLTKEIDQLKKKSVETSLFSRSSIFKIGGGMLIGAALLWAGQYAMQTFWR